MRLISFSLLLTAVFLTNGTLIYGQPIPAATPFPTYQQIKPATTEIIDYVPKPGESLVIGQKLVFNLFDYPDNTVTYLLNGQPTTDSKYAKELANRKSTQVNHIKIGQPTSDGKLTIEIDYSTRK